MTNKIRVQAKKSLGQNFLVNEGVLSRIVQAAAVSQGDTILEVGPGTGALTERLAATGAQVFAIEKDKRLIKPLSEKFAGFSNVHIIEGNILEGGPPSQVRTPYKVVANIPYYLTSHLLRVMLEQWPSPSLAVLMVQHEVARRMMSKPPDMNLLALSVQLYATPSLVMRVSRGSFRPMPEVDSAVIRLEIEPIADKSENEKVLEIAKKAFGQKRKQLKASIPSEQLVKAGIEPSARPQVLTANQWKAIASGLQ